MAISNKKRSYPTPDIGLLTTWQQKISHIQYATPLLPSQERCLFSRFTSVHQGLSRQPRRLRRSLSRKARLTLTDIAFMLAIGIVLPLWHKIINHTK